MTLDDELRRRLQQAADRAGEGTDPAALTGAVAAKVAGGGVSGVRLLGGLSVAGLVVGGALGFTALRPSTDAASSQVVVAAEVQRASLFDCPDGAPTASVRAGDRLYAIGRTDDGGWLAVRPVEGGTVSWLPAEGLRTDDDRDLAVLTCTETIAMNTGPAATSTSMGDTTTSSTTTTVPATSTTTATTVPATVPPTVPPTAPPTAPPTTAAPDNQQPTVQASSNLSEIYDTSWPECENAAVLTAFAADNVGVTSVTGTWAGLGGSPKAFTKGAGNTWTATFGLFSGLGANYNQLVSITITARDAAGNTAATVVQVRVYGTCLL